MPKEIFKFFGKKEQAREKKEPLFATQEELVEKQQLLKDFKQAEQDKSIEGLEKQKEILLKMEELDERRKQRIARETREALGEIIIKAKTLEGKEIEFNLEKIKQYWIKFYRQNNLQQLAEAIEDIEIQLTDEQIEKIKEKAKEGFNKLILLPAVEIQKQNLNQIKEQTEKLMKGLKDKQQYAKEGMYWGPADSDFPDHIQTNNRPSNKAYLLFLKDDLEVGDDTRGKTPEILRQEFKQKLETGLTLEEYLIFQRDYTQIHIKEDKSHPDTQYGTWLLDSELDPQSSGPGLVLCAVWSPDYRRVGVSSYPVSIPIRFGARSSAIFEIL